MFSHLGHRTRKRQRRKNSDMDDLKSLNNSSQPLWRAGNKWIRVKGRWSVKKQARKKANRIRFVKLRIPKLRSFRSRWHFRKGVSFPLPQATLLAVSIDPFFEMDSSIFLTYPPFYLLSFIRSLDEGRKESAKRERNAKKEKKKTLSLFVEKWKSCRK